MTSPKLGSEDQVVVWQAQGILMESMSCEVAEAALMLRWRSLNEKRGVVDAAAAVLSEWYG